MFVRIEVVDCFVQKPSSIVTSVFFITNRPLYAQIILDECIGLLPSTENHAQSGRRTLTNSILTATLPGIRMWRLVRCPQLATKRGLPE